MAIETTIKLDITPEVETKLRDIVREQFRALMSPEFVSVELSSWHMERSRFNGTHLTFEVDLTDEQYDQLRKGMSFAQRKVRLVIE